MLQARFVLITLRISAHNSVDCVGVPVHFSQLCIVAQNNAPELKQNGLSLLSSALFVCYIMSWSTFKLKTSLLECSFEIKKYF